MFNTRADKVHKTTLLHADVCPFLLFPSYSIQVVQTDCLPDLQMQAMISKAYEVADEEDEEEGDKGGGGGAAGGGKAGNALVSGLRFLWYYLLSYGSLLCHLHEFQALPALALCASRCLVCLVHLVPRCITLAPCAHSVHHAA
jgi:hypothetical protein